MTRRPRTKTKGEDHPTQAQRIYKLTEASRVTGIPYDRLIRLVRNGTLEAKEDGSFDPVDCYAADEASRMRGYGLGRPQSNRGMFTSDQQAELFEIERDKRRSVADFWKIRVEERRGALVSREKVKEETIARELELKDLMHAVPRAVAAEFGGKDKKKLEDLIRKKIQDGFNRFAGNGKH